MRVEVTFGGDSLEATEASRLVVDALQKLFLQSDVTAASLREVKITTAQASESALEGRRIQDSLKGIQQEARQTRRDLDSVQLGGLQGAAQNLRSFRTVGIASLFGLGAAASGPVGLAAGGALAALPGFIATVTAGVGGLALAFGGMSKAIEGDKKAFDALNPSAQQFVQTVRSLDPFLQKLRQDVQASVLPASTGFLHELFDPANVQAFQKAATEVGQALASGISEWGRALGTTGFASGFSTFAKDAAGWLQQDADAALHFATGLGRIGLAGLPITAWLTNAVQHFSLLFDQWTKNAQASGALASGMDKARQELELVAHFVGALGDAVYQLSRALLPLGNEILAGATTALQHFADWIDRNRQEINNVAQGALKALVGILTALRDILVPVGKALYDVTQQTIGFKNAALLLVGVWASWKIASLVAGLVGGATSLVGALGIAKAETLNLRAALISLSAVEVLGSLAAVAAAVYAIINPSKVISPGPDPSAGKGTGKISAGLAKSLIGDKKPFVNVTGGPKKGEEAWDLGNGQSLAREPDGSYKLYYTDNGVTVPGLAPGYKPPAALAAQVKGQVAASVSAGLPAALTETSPGSVPPGLAGVPLGSSSAAAESGRQKLIKFATQLLGVPYVWGGEGSNGVDCSGLVAWAFGQSGVTIPHFTGDQAALGNVVAPSGIQAGDVIFTNYGEKEHGNQLSGTTPGHEGIYAGGGMVIEASSTSGKVIRIPFSSFVGGQTYNPQPTGAGQYTIRDLYATSGLMGTGFGTPTPPLPVSSAFGTPPPFTKNLGTPTVPVPWSLGIGLQTALAQGTPPYPGATLATETTVLRKIIASIRGQIGDLKGSDLLSASQELASYISQLSTLTAGLGGSALSGLLQSTFKQYPGLSQFRGLFAFKALRQSPLGYQSESYHPGDTASFDPAKNAIALYGTKNKPADVAGEIVSHFLAQGTSPALTQLYQQFTKTITPGQLAWLHRDYKQEGDGRPFGQFERMSGFPALFRGQLFGQLDSGDVTYTAEQQQLFAQVMTILRTHVTNAPLALGKGLSGVGSAAGRFGGRAGAILAALAGNLNIQPPDFFSRQAATPSVASLISAGTYAHSITALLGQNPAATPGTPGSLAAAIRPFDELKATLGPKIKALSKEIATQTLSSADLATVRAQLDKYRTQIQTSLDNTKQAITAEKSSFQAAWQSLGQAATNALQNAAANYQSPADILLQQLQSAHDDQQLQSALDKANKDLADALVPKPDPNTIVDNIKAIIGVYTEGNAIDQVQSALLGGSSVGIDSNSLLGKLHDALNAASAPDPNAVAAAQQEVSDAQYSIQVAGLQKQATADDKSYTDMVSRQETAIATLSANWAKYYAQLGGKISGVASAFAGQLSAAGVSPDDINATVAAAVAGGLALPPATAGSFGTIVSGYGPGGPIQLHAAGGVATRPIYRNIIGEAGPEAIIPLSDPRSRAMLGGGTIELHMHGDIGSAVRTEISSPHTLKIIDHGVGRDTDRRRRARAI